MNLLNLIENTTAGYDNLRALMQAVQNSQDAVLNIGGDPVTLEYPEARFMLGKYRAYNKAGRQEEFLRDLADPVRFDLHMKQLRDLIAKQKNFRGSVPGQRGVTGDVPEGVMEGLDSLDEIALQDPENMTTETYGKLNWENMLRAYMDNRPYAEFEFGKSSSPLTLYRNQIYAILKAFGNMKPQQKVNIILSVFGDKMATVEYLDKLRQKGRIPKVAPFYKSPDAAPVSPQQMELPGMPAPRIKEASAQKKNSDKPEFDRTTAVNPKVQRAFQLARARQAASGSDIEAFVKDELEKAEQAQAEIEQLKQDNEAQDQQIRQLAAKVAQQDQTISQPAEPEVSTPAEPTGRVEPKKAEEPKADQAEPKKREEPKGQAEPKRREEPRAEPARVPKPEKPQAQKPPKPPKPPKPQRPPKPEPEVPDNVIQGPWGQPGTVPQDDDIAAAISGLDIPMTGTYGGIQRVKEDTQELHVGDPVIIQGNVEFKGKTGDIAGFGRDKHFVIVDLYNFGKHAFHASNVAYNDYADQADYVDEMQTKIDRSNISRPILPSGAAKLKYAQDHNMYDDARVQEALPDKAMAVLRGLKQTPQAQTAEPVSPQKQAELDQWAQDFQRNVADKFGKQVVTPVQQPAIDLNVPVPKKRGRPSNIQRDLERSEYAKIKQQIAQLDELIKMKELIDKLFLKAQNVRGGIYPGLQSDIEDEEMYGVPQTDQEFAALKDKYTRDLAALQKFLAMKKAMYREGQDRISESTALVRLKQARQALSQQGVTEGHADQQRKIFKKNGKPVGEVGIDRESSPGVGQWYMKYYPGNIDHVGYDSYEEALDELKHCVKQGVVEAQTDYQKRRQRERDVDAGRPVKSLPKNPQTDYARKRAQQKRDQELGEKKDRSPGKITKSEDPCWSGYHMVGKKMKNGREVPNCVPGKKG